MKKKSLIICFLSGAMDLCAQNNINEDSLRLIINQQKNDTNEVKALVSLSNQKSHSDSVIKYAQQGLLLAQKISYKKGEADCLFLIAESEIDFTQTIENGLHALNIYNDLHNHKGIASTHLILQGTYREAKDYRNALMHAFLGEQISEANNEIGELVFRGHRLAPLFLAEISQTYVLMKQTDSALIYAKKSIAQNELFRGTKWNFPIYLLGTIQNLKGNYIPALTTYRSAIPLAKQNEIFQDTLQILSGISTVFKNMGELDSAIYYAKMVEQSTNPEKEISYLLNAVENLGQAYKSNRNKDSALKYIELGYTLKDSVFSNDRVKEVQNITFNEKLKQQEILSAHEKYKSKVNLYALGTGLLVLLLIALLLWRSNQQKQKAKAKIEKAYSDLKAAQAQLIQSEKMASLGELTAGIAHEILNPLNFVNNFSEVNSDLIEELKSEKSKVKNERNEQLEDNLLNDISENEKKINHHGKRADAIVKGMLQHSRSSTGVKEPTDINKLADEYLRLAYHGLRAKDKDFNAELKTDFDETIGSINVIPQDIGRVLLNLYNNAFYAVSERQKAEGLGYEPIVSIVTKLITTPSGERGVSISIRDNGNGISQKIIDKIFQPFFTTKPTGQGTGLGLSLSYDIVKAHGGEIKVASMESEGTGFTIQLPVV